MDGGVAHCASLILGCLVVRWPTGPLRGERVALQTQEIDLAHPKQAWVCGTMGRVATAATFRFHWNMFVYKWPSRICVALGADGVSAGQSFHLPQGCGAMRVMAVAAVKQAFIDAVVIGFGKIGLGRGMAAVALFRLFLNQQILGSFGVVRRMAVKTTHIIAGVRGIGEVALFVLRSVATEAPGIGFLAREILEADDLGNVSAALHMRLSRAMAGFAAVSISQRCFEMWSVLKAFFKHRFVACLASIAAGILFCLLASVRALLFLSG